MALISGHCWSPSDADCELTMGGVGEGERERGEEEQMLDGGLVVDSELNSKLRPRAI